MLSSPLCVSRSFILRYELNAANGAGISNMAAGNGARWGKAVANPPNVGLSGSRAGVIIRNRI